ncbi:hypothetical protein ACFX5Q_11820 [Mesorhizobium sp. IMUNJ 23033]|uniref:hypothetical protein n=1 Tax=Mesorhizobium sp. IMUNJ 23033 TaxID=3378039 RepID=UPI00384D597B
MVSGILDVRPVTDDDASSTTAAQVRAQAEARGGSPDDMALRAASYYELYRSAGRSFPFAIIASHGALWAYWYLKLADVAARVLAVIDVTSILSHAERVASYDRFVDKFREINRVVFIETWVALHLLRLDRDHPHLVDRMPEPLRHAIADAQNLGREPNDEDKRRLFEDYFRWEQVVVVGPMVQAAVDEFHWELARWFCRRPWVWFSYFRVGKALVFRDFTDAEERTQKGLAAFDWAARKGWGKIESNLLRNPLFPGPVQVPVVD